MPRNLVGDILFDLNRYFNAFCGSEKLSNVRGLTGFPFSVLQQILTDKIHLKNIIGMENKIKENILISS